MRVYMSIILEFDDKEHFSNDQEKKWFYEEFLLDKRSELILHSNYLGDTIGTVIGTGLIEQD